MILDYEKAKDAVFRAMSGKVSTVTATRVILALKEAAIEADPVVHGRWVTRKSWYFFVCSECSCESVSHSSYCPNCGARMDGDGNV